MPFDVRFSPRAEYTFDAIANQLEARLGNKTVESFKHKVNKALYIIAETPFIYPIAEENEEMRKCVLHKNCSMYYWVYENTVEILYFWDNRQEPLIF